MERQHQNRMQVLRGPALMAPAFTLALAATGCMDTGHHEYDDYGQGGREPCVQFVLCASAAHWDPYACQCAINYDGGVAYGDGGRCVQNVMCTQTAHWDSTRCRCVANPPDAATTATDVATETDVATGTDASLPDASAPEVADGGACCPANWLLYECQLPNGDPGLACHNPAMGCASSLICGQGCDSVVAGRC